MTFEAGGMLPTGMHSCYKLCYSGSVEPGTREWSAMFRSSGLAVVDPGFSGAGVDQLQMGCANLGKTGQNQIPFYPFP